MADIFTLGIKADTTDIDRGAKSLDRIADSSDKAEKSTIKLRKGINDAGLAITAFGAAGAAALGAITVSAGDAAKEIENLSRLSNLTAEEFQRSAFAARTFGVEQDKLSDILKDTQDKVGDFLTTGGGPMLDFFEKIAPKVGVTADQFRGLNGKDALQLYVTSLEKANLSQSDMVFFLEAIANDATLLQPLLANGGKEFERLGQRADDLNIILSDFDIDSLADMNAALMEMGAISDATGNVIGATLAPFVTDLVTQFNNAAISGDTLRDTVLDVAGAGVAVAGVFADAGRVFEIFGLAIAASMFEISQRFDTFEERNQLALTNYELFGQEMVLSTAEWINELVAGVVDGVNEVTEALNFGGLLDSVIIEAPQIDTSGFVASISELEAEVLGLESSLVQSNRNIANAWQDVIDLTMQPLPSEGMKDHFNAIRKSVEEVRTLQVETEKLDKKTRSSKIGTVAIDWEKGFKKSGEAMGALQTIFGKNEKAAKALHAVNEGIALAEAVMSIEKMISSTTEAATVVASETIKQGALATTAIVNQGGGDPYTAFARIATMTALMASIVGAVSGGGGTAVPEEQSTVLGGGDPSESLSKASDRFEDIQISQLAELRGIKDAISRTEQQADNLAKSIIEGGAFDSVGGFSQNDFFSTPVVNEVSMAFDEITQSITTGVNEAAESLGVSIDQAIFSTLSFSSGQFKDILKGDLDGDELVSAINEIISAGSDRFVNAALPSLKQFQEIGEGAFETLSRVTQEQATFNDAIDQMGISLSDLSGIMQLEIGQSIIDLVGDVEKFSDLTGEFFSEFFSEAEQFDQLAKSLTEAVGGLGISMFDTRNQFREAIEILDLTTEADQKMLASLLELVPAMDEFFDAVESGEIEALAAAEKKLSDDRDAALKIDQEASKAVRDLALSIEALTRSLTTSAKGALTDLSNSIKESQGGISRVLKDTLSGIATDFDAQRQSILERTTSQVSSMEMQLGLVNDRVSELAGLSGLLSGSLATLSGSTRGKARADIQSAITAGNAGQDLAGLGLEGAISTLANIDQSSFGSTLELRLEQARTASELGELKSLTDDQLTLGELNSQLIEQQISAIQTASDVQIATLFDVQDKAERDAQENSSEQIAALNDILENAKDELNAVLGVESGVLSLVVAQDMFRQSIDALAMQVTEQSQQAADQASQAQASQAEANAAANVADNSDSNAAMLSIAENSRKTNKLLNRWDTDGQPEVRSAS